MEDIRENRPNDVKPQFRRQIWALQAILSKAGENHLGVALMQPGGSRYEQMKVADEKWIVCKKGGTAYLTSLAILVARDFFA